MTERWLPVVGWEGYYEVSDMGRVRSVDRTIIRSDGKPRFWSGRVLAAKANRHGYPLVALSRCSDRSSKKVHRLVLEAFIGPCPDGMVACHFDGDRANARLGNLRWDTPSSNRLDTIRYGGDPKVNQTHCIHGHPFDEQNTKRVPSRPNMRQCRACHRERSRKSTTNNKRGTAA